jgi:hypothetical protein
MSTSLPVAQDFALVQEQYSKLKDGPVTAATDAEKVFNCHKRLKEVLERQKNDWRSTAADRQDAEGMLASLEPLLPSAEQLILAHGYWQRIEKDVGYQDSQFGLLFDADQAHDKWQATENHEHHEAFRRARDTYQAYAEGERTKTEEAYRAFQHAEAK